MRPLITLSAFLTLSTLASALPGETLGTYFDAAGTQTTTAVTALQSFQIYFIADNIPTAVAGYEFYVNMPPELMILSATAHPVAFNTLDIDSSPEGFIVGIGGACLQGPGPIVLAEFTCMALQPAANLSITISPSVPSSFGGTAAGYAECGTLALFPFADAYPGPARVDVFHSAAFCFCDGSGHSAPCGNEGAPGRGCRNSFSANGASLHADGLPSASASTIVLYGTDVPPGRPGLFFQGVSQVNGGTGSLFGDGLRCAGGAVTRLELVVFDSLGDGATSIDLASAAGLLGGETRVYQLWYRDPNVGPCGSGFNTSNALEITWMN